MNVTCIKGIGSNMSNYAQKVCVDIHQKAFPHPIQKHTKTPQHYTLVLSVLCTFCSLERGVQLFVLFVWMFHNNQQAAGIIVLQVDEQGRGEWDGGARVFLVRWKTANWRSLP